MLVAVDIAETTFGPLEKYVAANDNISQPIDESGASAVFGVGPARRGDWMQTFTGRQFWPLDPRPEDVCIEDIAHSLSLQCRYAGHCLRFYSVGEHSVLIARYLAARHDPAVALWGLLHDAAEAYLVDVPRPVKPYLAGYKDAENRVMGAITRRFNIAAEMPSEVRNADDRIIGDETANLVPMDWHKRYEPLGVKLRYWTPEEAEREFLATFQALVGEMHKKGQPAA